MENKKLFYSDKQREIAADLIHHFQQGAHVVGKQDTLADNFIYYFSSLQEDTGEEPWFLSKFISELMKMFLSDPELIKRLPEYEQKKLGSILFGLQQLFTAVSDNEWVMNAINTHVYDGVTGADDERLNNILFRSEKEYIENKEKHQRVDNCYSNSAKMEVKINQLLKELDAETPVQKSNSFERLPFIETKENVAA